MSTIGAVSSPTDLAPGQSRAATLRVESLHVAYGKIVAIPDLSFSVPAGRVLAILGPNGAGKTTTANALSGVIASTASAIKLDEEELNALPPDRRIRAGLGHLPDHRAIFPSLTVIENLRISFTHEGSRARMRQRITEAFERFPALERRQRVPAGRLSGGEQQMLATVRHLVVPPRVLILDEPSHGLAPVIVSSLFDAFDSLKGKTTIVVIEQFVSRAVALADDVMVLSHGQIVHQGPAASFTPEMAAELYSLT